MSEITRGAPQLSSDDRESDDDVLWVPAEQPAKRAFFEVHDGALVLAATCDDCGLTTSASPELHLFLPCAHCDGEITITWDPALA